MESNYQILQNNPVSDLRKALTHYNSESKISGISKLKREALVTTIKNRFKPPKISTQNGDIMLDARDIAVDTYRLKPKKKKEKKVSKPVVNRTIKIKKKKNSKPMKKEEPKPEPKPETEKDIDIDEERNKIIESFYGGYNAINGLSKYLPAYSKLLFDLLINPNIKDLSSKEKDKLQDIKASRKKIKEIESKIGDDFKQYLENKNIKSRGHRKIIRNNLNSYEKPIRRGFERGIEDNPNNRKIEQIYKKIFNVDLIFRPKLK